MIRRTILNGDTTAKTVAFEKAPAKSRSPARPSGARILTTLILWIRFPNPGIPRIR